MGLWLLRPYGTIPTRRAAWTAWTAWASMYGRFANRPYGTAPDHRVACCAPTEFIVLRRIGIPTGTAACAVGTITPAVETAGYDAKARSSGLRRPDTPQPA